MDPVTFSRVVMGSDRRGAGRPLDVEEMARRLGVEPEEARAELR